LLKILSSKEAACLLAGHRKVGRLLFLRVLLVHALVTGIGFFLPDGSASAAELRLRVASITQGGKSIDRVSVRLTLPGTGRDETHTLELAYPLQRGTIIRVPGRTVIRLESDNRNTITLEPNTVFTIEALEPEGEAYSMCEGKAIFSVTKALDFFNVSCKRFLAAVRGTEFSVEAHPATKIRYEVTEGRVLVSRIVKVRVGEDQSNAVDELASEELSRNQKPRAEYPLNEDEYIYKFKSYQDALDHHTKRLGIAQSAEDYFSAQQILTSLGIIQARLGRADLSIPYFEEALTAAKGLRDNKRIAWALNNLSISYYELSDYTKSIEFQRRALAIRRTLFSEVNIEIADSYHNLARAYHALDDFCPALVFNDKALKIKRQLFTNPRREIGESLLNIGAVFFDLGRYHKAVTYQEEALAVWEKLYPKRAHPYIALSYQLTLRSAIRKTRLIYSLEFFLRFIPMSREVMII
jgi:tetratricopeptide (TPR) repeat protein